MLLLFVISHANIEQYIKTAPCQGHFSRRRSNAVNGKWACYEVAESGKALKFIFTDFNSK